MGNLPHVTICLAGGNLPETIEEKGFIGLLRMSNIDGQLREAETKILRISASTARDISLACLTAFNVVNA